MPEKIKPGRFEEIVNLAKKGGIKEIDEKLIRSSIVKTKEGMIDLPNTAAKVEERLVPLTPTPVKYPRYSNIGEDFIGEGKYGETVYQSPIKTSAGDVHFQGRTLPDAQGNYIHPTKGGKTADDFPNYFSHTRFEDMADGKTRKILETQSDLVQKGKLIPEIGEAKKVLLSALEDTMPNFRTKHPNIDKQKIIDYVVNCL